MADKTNYKNLPNLRYPLFMFLENIKLDNTIIEKVAVIYIIYQYLLGTKAFTLQKTKAEQKTM